MKPTTKARRLSAGEIRFRVSKTDLDRIDKLLSYYEEYQSISALLRALIVQEYARMMINKGIPND